MKRARSRSRIDSDNRLLSPIIEIKSDHPFWGYRRIWAYLRFRKGIIVGRNRIYRLMKENKLLITKKSRLLAKRTAIKPKLKSTHPNDVWGTDMTKVKLAGFVWVYLHIVLDWYTKEVIGYSCSFQSKTSDWLDALYMAVNARYPNGILESDTPPKLVTDNGCQPSSMRYMKACSELKISQIFTSWNNPKGNADTERFMRTLKEDLMWPHCWGNPFSFETALKAWISDYNLDFPHQSLNYNTPSQFYAQFIIKNKEVIPVL